MPQDLSNLLEKIKVSAIERCRDRLDTAAGSAKGLINTNSVESCKKFPSLSESHGVTSTLKRRHGL